MKKNSLSNLTTQLFKNDVKSINPLWTKNFELTDYRTTVKVVFAIIFGFQLPVTVNYFCSVNKDRNNKVDPGTRLPHSVTGPGHQEHSGGAL